MKYLTAAVRKVHSSIWHYQEGSHRWFSIGSLWQNHSSFTESQARRVAITNREQKALLELAPESPPHSRLLKVTIIGTPNAGKSTLANKLMGWRYSASSMKVHTTRHKTIGVHTKDQTQIVFLDTPGMIAPWRWERNKMEKSLLTDPHAGLFEADTIAVVVDVAPVWNKIALDQEILKVLQLHKDKQAILILNKVDLIKNKKELLTITRNLTQGIVDGQISWEIQKKNKTPDIEELFDNMEKRHPTKSKNLEINHHITPNTSDRQVHSAIEPKTIVYEKNNSEQDENDLDAHLEQYEFSEINEVYISSDGERIEVHLEEDSDAKDDHVAEIMQDHLDLSQEEVWDDYEERLKTASRQVENQTGWPGFERVFLLSAKAGGGVEDLMNWLYCNARPSPWYYSSSVVTDQAPLDIARMIIWEKMLDHLPNEIPYAIDIKRVSWVMDENNILRVQFDLICSKRRFLYHLLRNKGCTIQKIAAEAKQELMNTFKTEVSLHIVVKATPRLKEAIDTKQKYTENQRWHKKNLREQDKNVTQNEVDEL